MSNDEKDKLINIVLEYHCDGEHHLQYLIDQILKNFLNDREYQKFLEQYSDGGIYDDWETGICP